MPARRCAVALIVAGLLHWCQPSLVVSQQVAAQQVDAKQPDQVVAGRILGQQWKQLSTRAGMIFAGTVIGAATPSAQYSAAVPTIEFRFRVDRAIAGVESGQILTVHEWTGALPNQRPMSRGQRFLVFLYPPSRLGLTSPVGGAHGQIALDAGGTYVATEAESVRVAQLERAIRSARVQ
ncbi:MAG TPA: hypothetical protein VKR59_19055 [Terriglobales bacterium]|nr:hypothetical protein [Terriglobales bacterium]